MQLCCKTTKWHITQSDIDVTSGCCGSKEDTVQMRRVRDIAFESACLVRACCCGRGTIVIHCADATHPELRLTTQHAKGLYRELKDVINASAAGRPQVIHTSD